MNRKNFILTLSVVSTAACLISTFLTASVALGFNERLKFWINTMGHRHHNPGRE